MKLLKRLAVLSLCALTVTGCAQSAASEPQETVTEAVETSAVPSGSIIAPDGSVIIEDDGPESRPVLIDENAGPETIFQWDQVEDDAEYMFEDPDFYELGVDMTYEGDEDAKTIKLMWKLKNETTEEEALEYATELVQNFNDILAIQRSDYERSTRDSFGSVWDTFALTVQISTEDGKMLVDKAYEAGEAIDLPLPQYSGNGPSANLSTEAPEAPGMGK